jgi:hypothetical protein
MINKELAASLINSERYENIYDGILMLNIDNGMI